MDLSITRHILEWLSQSRDFLDIHDLDARRWQRVLWATKLKKTPVIDQHKDPVPALPEPYSAWDDRHYSTQSDRWDAYMSLLCYVNVLCVMGSW